MYYQNTSEYDYVDDFRQQQFQNLVGQLFTIPQSVTLANGQTLQSGTRVFIHRVTFTPSGQEMVTIVFPLGIGGNPVVGLTQVSGSQLSGAAVQFFQMSQGQGQGFGGHGHRYWQKNN